MATKLTRLLTGRAQFDRLFHGGGILVDDQEGTSILIEGEAGLGKTTLALQIAAHTFRGDKASCLYYTFEQSARAVKSMIDGFKWKLDTTELQWSETTTKIRDRGFYIIDGHDRVGIDIDATLEAIREHTSLLEGGSTGGICTPIVVFDSIGAIEHLVTLERRCLGRLIARMRDLRAVLILVREHDRQPNPPETEYLTNVILDLHLGAGGPILAPGGTRQPSQYDLPRSFLEIKKTRNQQSARGPHQFEILRPPSATEPGGCVLYPALQTVAEERNVDQPKVADDDRARFGLSSLDAELDDGMPFGQSLLVKGPPGSLKTELGVQFLLEGLRDEKSNDENGHVLFVSCKIDEFALDGLEVFTEDQRSRFSLNRTFVDARPPYQTPEQVMARVVEAVVDRRIRRAVIFGIGMLDTLPAFQGNALPFLQVLIRYFQLEKVSGVFIDWPQVERESSSAIARPTELVGDFVAGAIEIAPSPNYQGSSEARLHPGGELRLVRKDYRFVNRPLGWLTAANGRLEILENTTDG